MNVTCDKETGRQRKESGSHDRDLLPTKSVKVGVTMKIGRPPKIKIKIHQNILPHIASSRRVAVPLPQARSEWPKLLTPESAESNHLQFTPEARSGRRFTVVVGTQRAIA